MSKVKCKVCANEVTGVCSIKKMKVKPNKSRRCEAYIYDEAKVKEKESIPTVRIGYTRQQELKRRYKEEMKELKRQIRDVISGKVQDGTAKNLGLIEDPRRLAQVDRSVGAGYEKTASGLIVPQGSQSSKHPLTGDLSRFTTSAKKEDE